MDVVRNYDVRATELFKGKRSFSLLIVQPSRTKSIVVHIYWQGVSEVRISHIGKHLFRSSLVVREGWRGLTHHPCPSSPLWKIPTHVTSRARGPPDGRHDVTIPPATIGLNHWHIHVIGSSFVFSINRWLTACEPYWNSYRQGVSISKQSVALATVPHFRT